MNTLATDQSPAAAALSERKRRSRAYIRSLPPEEKVRLLMNLQEQTYQFLLIREQNGGRPVPKRWKEWYQARKAYFDSLETQSAF